MGGVTWTVADNFRLYNGDAPSHACGIAADATGNLYVVGTAATVVLLSLLTARRR